MAASSISFDNLVIHGSISQAQSQGYTNPVGWEYTSHNGNPAICMALTVSDFKRNADKSCICKISRASIRSLQPSTKFFGYPIDVSACIVVGNVDDYHGDYKAMIDDLPHYGETLLFQKPNGVSQWNDYAYGISEPVTLSIPDRGNNHVYFIISTLSICTCAQNGESVPVYCDNLDPYIPELDAPVTPDPEDPQE